MYWSNSCCSHPRKDESIDIAATRRLQDELNVSSSLEFVYKFAYQASFGESGSENELCSIFLGRIEDETKANATEIEALRYIAVDSLRDELAAKPDRFTPWLRLELQRLTGEFAETLVRYTTPR